MLVFAVSGIYKESCSVTYKYTYIHRNPDQCVAMMILYVIPHQIIRDDIQLLLIKII